MKYEEYERIIEKINFEERWMLDLHCKNELKTIDVKISMSSIRHILWELLEEHEKGSD